MIKNDFDVVIVGGGIGGLYSALRLSRSPIFSHQKIALFEATDRIGGRIRSLKHKELALPCELGCMRYLKSQRLITALIEDYYKLTTQPFDTGEVSRHIYYLRGRHIDTKTWDVPYVLPESMRGKSPFHILDHVIDNIKARNGVSSPTTPEEWADIKKQMRYPTEGLLEGQFLQDIGFANLISQSSSYETLKFLADSGEYYAKTINWNSAEAFPYSQSIGYKAKDDIDYWCIKDGFTALTDAMLKDYLGKGGSAYLNSALQIIKKNHGESKKYTLVFQDTKTNQSFEVSASTIILALPKTALKNIIWLDQLATKFYSNEFKTMLASVRNLPTLRFALLFKEAWWKNIFNGLNGHMVTDLPLRHGYYFGSQKQDQYSVFLSTVDVDVTDYWLPFLSQDRESGFLSDLAVKEILRQLCVIHRNAEIENPICGAYANWSSSFYGGGFHSWYPQYDVPMIMKKMRKPFADENIHIIGEAFSGLQGWAEGALCTAENLMREHFNLALNESWLDSNYFYGY